MKTKKIKILKRFTSQYEVGEEVEVEVDDLGKPVSPFWRRCLVPDVAYIGWVKETPKKKADKKKEDVNNIGDENE